MSSTTDQWNHGNKIMILKSIQHIRKENNLEQFTEQFITALRNKICKYITTIGI